VLLLAPHILLLLLPQLLQKDKGAILATVLQQSSSFQHHSQPCAAQVGLEQPIPVVGRLGRLSWEAYAC